MRKPKIEGIKVLSFLVLCLLIFTNIDFSIAQPYCENSVEGDNNETSIQSDLYKARVSPVKMLRIRKVRKPYTLAELRNLRK